MIDAFISGFSLFWQTYLTTILMSAVLGCAGVLVVTRGQVFIAAAIAQASLLGIAVSLLFNFGNTVIPAVAFSVGASLFIGGSGNAAGGGRRHGLDERTALVFLLSGSLGVLLLSSYPSGLRELQSAAASSLFGVDTVDFVLFLIFGLVLLISLVLMRSKLVLFILDPVMAAAVGLDILKWSMVISGILGLMTGLAIQSSGMLFTFGALVLPAMAARNICREVGTLFLASPILGVLGALIGLFLSAGMDLPPGQTTVVVQCSILILSWVWRQFRIG